MQIQPALRLSLILPSIALAALAWGCGGDDVSGDTEGSTGMTTESSQGSHGTLSEGSSTTSTSSEGTGGSDETESSAGSETSDSTSAGTGEPLSCADLPLCDGFEGASAGGPPDPGLWSVVSPNCSGLGSLEVDGEVAYRGSRSLRVDGAGGYCDHIFIANDGAMADLVEESGEVYGRFYMRLSDPLGGGHVTFLTMRDEADGAKDLRMGGQSEILMWNRESDDATLPALSPTGISMSVRPSAGSWSCVEFMVDGSMGALRTWVDGVEVSGLEVDGEPTMDVDQQWHQKGDWKPSLGDFKLGWESYAGQGMTLWFDEVALGGERIGCA